MLLGHFGIGFGAKAIAPKASLGSMFLASLFVDLVFPTLLLLGVERVTITPGITKVTPLDFVYYPISHSLLAVLLWAVLVAVVYMYLRHYSRGALVLGLAVVSHWFLDAIVHRPDLALYPGSGVFVGFGVWSSLPGTLAAELLIFGIGLGIYLRTTKPADKIGVYSLGTLVIFLLVLYMGAIFGPPPPGITALAWAGEAQWLFVLWGYWIDRHRIVPSE
ncbi:MAG TPA: hypothetical protein HA257_08265 [Candidatus Methanoperedenaceae archaeon]|nr:hypothetical protein [Candidatus Methanoperedenaceae archaeon]